MVCRLRHDHMLTILEMRPPEKCGHGLNDPIEGSLEVSVQTSPCPGSKMYVLILKLNQIPSCDSPFTVVTPAHRSLASSQH